MKEQFSDRIKLQLDGNKMLSHLDEIEKWKEDQWSINPIYIAFSPSSMCNHKCTFCVYHYKEFKPIYFPLERYKELVDEWSELGVKSIFFAGDGDPRLNKDCIEMVQYTKSKNIDIALNTNARLLNEEKSKILAENLSWIRVSLNAGSAANYSKIHGTSEKDFNIVLKNLEYLVKNRSNQNQEFVIGVQCLLLKENFLEIRELAKMLKNIGVDYFAVKPFLKHPLIEYNSEIENKDEIIKELSKAESLNDENFKFVLRQTNFYQSEERSYKKCLSGAFMIEVDARGNVYSCGPYINDENHLYGNIIENSFTEMWNSSKRKESTLYIQNKLDVSKCMPSCRPDSVNRFLWEIKNPPMHINFI